MVKAILIDVKTEDLIMLIFDGDNADKEHDEGAATVELVARFLQEKTSEKDKEGIKKCLSVLTKADGEVGVLARDACRTFGISFGGPLPPIMHL